MKEKSANSYKKFLSLSAVLDPLFKPVDIASIILFRIAFGLIMLWEVWRYIDHHWIERLFIDPPFHFTYYGFSWISPWSGDGMYYHFFALGILAISIAYGFFYRITTTLFFLGFTYVFLLDQATYLNHLYLVSLISFIMIFVPAHWNYSFDSWKNPKIRSNTVPAWALWILRIQIGIPYFFGGIAKLNMDWLHGEPLRMWLGDRSDLFLIGPYMKEEWVIYFFSYSGLLFDLLIVPLLLWKKTRPLALLCAIFFNLTNAWLFKIGIFPWFMIVATTMFLEPSWPRKFLRISKDPSLKSSYCHTSLKMKYLTATVLGLYLLIQFSVPFRHFLYPSKVHWTEEGHRFSWHMKLRDKDAEAKFYAYNPQIGVRQRIDPSKFLSKKQYGTMINRPDMILQFAHHVSKTLSTHPDNKVEVYADILVSLNGRKHQRMIDQNVNLAAEERSLRHANWILPLDSE